MDNTYIDIEELVGRIEKAYPDFFEVCGKMGEGVRTADNIQVMLRSPLQGELPARSYSFRYLECFRMDGTKYKVRYMGAVVVDSVSLKKLLGQAVADGFTIEMVSLMKKAERKDAEEQQ